MSEEKVSTLTDWKNSSFFVPVNTLFFQNLRENEKIRKEALHALIERWKLSLELGRKLKEQVGDKNLTPTSRHTPYPVLPRVHEPIIYVHTWHYRPKKDL